MYAHPDAGRNDHIHGDENYREPEVTVDDVVEAIAHNGSTEDFNDYVDWHRRLSDGDATFNIIKHICQNIDKPEYAYFADQIKNEIEGWI